MENHSSGPASMSLEDWLDAYAESHQNPTNILIHKICVPVIFWSLLGMLAGIQHWLSNTLFGIICLGGLFFYARLSLKVFAGMFIALVLCHLSYMLILAKGQPLFTWSLTLFLAGWIGQFIGHNIEGRKPSFFEDLQFLLIGPVWVVYSLFCRD